MKLTALLLSIAVLVGSGAAEQIFEQEELSNLVDGCPVNITKIIYLTDQIMQSHEGYNHEINDDIFGWWERTQLGNDTMLVSMIRHNMVNNVNAAKDAR